MKVIVIPRVRSMSGIFLFHQIQVVLFINNLFFENLDGISF